MPLLFAGDPDEPAAEGRGRKLGRLLTLVSVRMSVYTDWLKPESLMRCTAGPSERLD